MHDRQVGRASQALRIRRGLRQSDVARRAGVSDDAVSILERGAIDRLSITMLRRLWSTLDVPVELDPRLSPAQVPNLLDAGHASLVERAVQLYRAAGWEALVELTFNYFGERGSVDLLGWHAASQTLSLNEVKTRLPDLQDLHATLDSKARIVPSLVARERGWHAKAIGRVLIVADARTNRRIVTEHAAMFATSFPARSREAGHWLRAPSGNLAALWFLPYPKEARSYGGRTRVRLREAC